MNQAVVLVAGQSTRTFPLTVTRPKALLSIANKPILAYILDALNECVKEVILVVNYKKEMIEKTFGTQYKKLSLRYVVQNQTKGTGHAVQQVEQYIGTEPFLVIVGDDYFDAADIIKMASKNNAILAQQCDNTKDYGVLSVHNNLLNTIEEKPKKPKSNYVNTGCYVFNKDIFPFLKKIKKSKRKEYELVDAVTMLTKQKPMEVVQTKHWQPITYPWHLLDANKKILEKIKFKSEGKIEPGVTIHGSVVVGKGTLVRSGSYIEGPVMIGENCTIGPNCYLRGATTIGNHVKIGNAVEVKNSVIGDYTNISHLSYIGDSVLGEKVNCGAGTIAANLRHDNATIKSEVSSMLIDSGRRKLGTIIGDNVHTGIHTSIYPGRKLWPSTITTPGEAVKKDNTN
ncbi:MAG: bifunctional sugar-1-phosphate nucleotidylyltransferase/acetyltransferase [Candidatus Woesearchaeota archaeon]|jgi:bifunctional UDP-N-acetylglucosamine pyrophosphorylase/glucosamine-1-phosphate N-acetyltransferase